MVVDSRRDVRDYVRDPSLVTYVEIFVLQSPMIVFRSVVASTHDETRPPRTERRSKCDFRRLWIGESAFTSASSALEPVSEAY